LYCAGHWVPDLVTAAGARPIIGARGDRSHPISVEQLTASDPEVIVVAPCGFGLDAAAAHAQTLVSTGVLPAAASVWAVDADAAFVRPGPRVIDGVETLAAIAHPDRVGLRPELGRRIS
jgi:iron complex transport system substrate-binding protein